MTEIIKNKIKLLVEYISTDNLQIKDSILQAYCDKFGAIGISELEADLAIYSQEIEDYPFLDFCQRKG